MPTQVVRRRHNYNMSPDFTQPGAVLKGFRKVKNMLDGSIVQNKVKAVTEHFWNPNIQIVNYGGPLTAQNIHVVQVLDSKSPKSDQQIFVYTGLPKSQV